MTAPQLSPDIQQNLEQYQLDTNAYNQALAQLKTLAAGLTNQGNVMLKLINIFAQLQNIEGDQIEVFSDVDNLDSTLRSKISEAQSDFNNMVNGKAGASGNSDAQDFINQVNQIQAFITYEQGQGKNSILDQKSLSNLQAALSSVKEPFGADWGKPSKMNDDISGWANLSKNGENAPQIKNIQDGLQTLNQSVSELSSSTNSQLQFTENQYKQALGEENSAMQSYQKMNSNTIRHLSTT